jgi:hypothetical protein
MTSFKVIDSRDLGSFIPSALDDLGLTPSQFRVYCHIARRAGAGVCYESHGSASTLCRMNKKTYIKSLHDLENFGLVEIERRIGTTHLVNLTSESSWVTPKEVQPHPKIDPPQKSIPPPWILLG